MKSCIEKHLSDTPPDQFDSEQSLQKLSSQAVVGLRLLNLACLSLVLNNLIINVDSIGFLSVDLGF